MTNINTKLHYEAFNNLDFDIPYYYDLCKGKKVLELCAGFGRVCNKLNNLGIDISAIELDKNNYNLINLPRDKVLNKNIFDCFDQECSYDVVIAPFNSFPIFYDDHELGLFFKLITKILKPNGVASLSYYHPDGWRIVPADEITLTIDGINYEYTSNFDLTNRLEKRAIWEDIFSTKKNKTIISTIKYDLKVYEDIDDVNIICNNYNLLCVEKVVNFYDPKLYEHGWCEYKIIKTR